MKSLTATLVLTLGAAFPVLAAPAPFPQEEAANPQAAQEAEQAAAEAKKKAEEQAAKAKEDLRQAQGERVPREKLEALELEKLEEEAKRVAERLKELDGQIEQAGETLKTASGEAKTKADEVLSNAQTLLKQNTDTLRDIVALLDAKESSLENEYTALLQERTGEVDITNVGAQLTFLQNQLGKLGNWFVEKGPGILGKILTFLIILLIFRWLAKLVARLVNRALSTSKLRLSDLLRNFFISSARKAVFLVGLMIALGSVGVDVGPVLAALGIGGFIIGFALQETLNNFAAGLMIMLYRPYDVGEVISAAGVTGKVDSMTLVSTVFLTPDNQKVIVPNGQIWGGVITNITANPTRRVDLVAGIGYEDDFDKAQELLLEIIKAHELVLADPEPVVRLNELADSSVNFVVRPWCKTSDYWTVYWDITREIKKRFDAEGLSIPYPQQDMHLHLPEALATKLAAK